MRQQIDWRPFRLLVRKVYRDGCAAGGRPHTDELVIVRTLLLQGWYGLSDEELEYQCNDRLSFRNFLGFPETVPDFTTIWKARDRLQEARADVKILAELQRQLDEKGYRIKEGVIQDASFIEAEYGRARRARGKAAEKKGEPIEYTPKQRAPMDKDSTYAVKGKEIHFGYKLHTKPDVTHGLIRSIETTTASTNDINLVKEGDVAAFRDKGYFGTELPQGVRDETMQRAVRGRKLNGGEQRRNRRISRTRSKGERPFAVIKGVFHGGVTFVTTLARVHIKNIFTSFAFDLYQLVTLRRVALA